MMRSFSGSLVIRMLSVFSSFMTPIVLDKSIIKKNYRLAVYPFVKSSTDCFRFADS